MDIQEYRGIRGLVGAEVTTDSAESFECGAPFPIAGVAELSRTTETTNESHYYDNVPAIVIESTGADEVTITGSAIPFDVLAKITGQHYDEAKGMFVEGERQSKSCLKLKINYSFSLAFSVSPCLSLAFSSQPKTVLSICIKNTANIKTWRRLKYFSHISRLIFKT